MSIELDGCAMVGMGGHLCEGIGGVRVNKKEDIQLLGHPPP